MHAPGNLMPPGALMDSCSWRPPGSVADPRVPPGRSPARPQPTSPAVFPPQPRMQRCAPRRSLRPPASAGGGIVAAPVALAIAQALHPPRRSARAEAAAAADDGTNAPLQPETDAEHQLGPLDRIFGAGRLGGGDAAKATAMVALVALSPGAIVGLYVGLHRHMKWSFLPAGQTLRDAAMEAGAGAAAAGAEAGAAPAGAGWTAAHREGAMLGVRAFGAATAIVAVAGYVSSCAVYAALGVSDVDGFIGRMKEEMPRLAAAHRERAHGQAEWVRPYAVAANERLGFLVRGARELVGGWP
eukprot:SAG22_NODE_5116_length_1082_cov_2.424212_1_plen_298_part_01